MGIKRIDRQWGEVVDDYDNAKEISDDDKFKALTYLLSSKLRQCWGGHIDYGKKKAWWGGWTERNACSDLKEAIKLDPDVIEVLKDETSIILLDMRACR